MPDAGDDFAAWQDRVRGTNISDATLLATDYLNHFNEIVMLLEMVPDMPDMLADCRDWTPKTYAQHFSDSGFSDRELAIAAYEHVPARFKQPFEEAVGHMNAIVARAIDQLDGHIATGDMELTRVTAHAAVRGLQRLIEVTSAIIHGAEQILNQDEIDAVLGF